MSDGRPDSLIDNAAWAGARPRLSVLIPFLGDDPVQLISELAAQAVDVEIILLDDGGADEALAARVTKAVQDSPAPARLLRSGQNLGRAKGRNRLTQQARADHFLFLDADMLPDAPTFTEAGFADATVQSWGSIAVPAGTPPAVAERLGAAVREAVAQPSVVTRMAAAGLVAVSNSQAEMQRFNAQEYERWGQVIRARNIRLE
jgi:tripartite-type tricarboxylate transporter receptor subunit TctC